MKIQCKFINIRNLIFFPKLFKYFTISLFCYNQHIFIFWDGNHAQDSMLIREGIT
jgi:hypothetical protein